MRECGYSPSPFPPFPAGLRESWGYLNAEANGPLFFQGGDQFCLES